MTGTLHFTIKVVASTLCFNIHWQTAEEEGRATWRGAWTTQQSMIMSSPLAQDVTILSALASHGWSTTDLMPSDSNLL